MSEGYVRGSGKIFEAPEDVDRAGGDRGARGRGVDPFEAALESATIHDEPLGTADREASEAGWSDYLSGEFSSLDAFLGRDATHDPKHRVGAQSEE